MSENKTYEGKIKFFNQEKGWGFVTMDGTEEDHFVHISGCIDSELITGDKVSFALVSGKKGLLAIQVTKI
jgi:CspA family cold shock protein